jgi:hypothetical protein
MHVPTAPQLSPVHQRLQALVGTWRGEESVGASQWTAAGAATSEVVADAEFGGFFVTQRYRQMRDGSVSFEAHNVFGVDQSDGTTKLWQFDSMGFVPPAPASGSWDGDTLTLERSSSRGAARTSYTFETPDRYRMTLQFRPAGSDAWQDMVEGTYRRLPRLNIHT